MQIEMDKQRNYVVAVDLGGTKIAAALFEQSGRLIRRELAETAGLSSAKEVVAKITAMIRNVSCGYPLKGIGMASPGTVDSHHGIVIQGTNLPEWNQVPLKDLLESELQTEVQVLNDANAAAWGEYVRGAGRGSTNMVYVTLSTGIGSGIVLGGKLFLGSSSFAGELGHHIIDPDGPLCNCGSKGCWEVFASGTAIGHDAARMAEEQESILIELAGGEAINARHVFEAKRRNDEVAGKVIDRAVYYMALGLVNIIHSFNPDRIIIGGGVSRSGDLLFPLLREKTEELVMPSYSGTYTIVPAELRDDVGLVGASALFG